MSIAPDKFIHILSVTLIYYLLYDRPGKQSKPYSVKLLVSKPKVKLEM